MSTPVIDFHTHPIYYDFYRDPALNWIKDLQKADDWDNFYAKFSDPAYFVSYLKKCGIDYAVVMADYSPLVVGICPNEYVLSFCKGHKELIPFASINPYLTPNLATELKKLVAAGFRGLKLYPTYQYYYVNDPLLYPLYSCAQELNVPIMIHTGTSLFKGARLKYGDPIFIDDVAVDFPGLNLVMVHGGRGFWYDRAFFLCRLHKNIFLEVAGLPPQKLLHYFPELETIASKVIFGSDWPGIIDIGENIAEIRRLGLSQEKQGKILGGNAAVLLNII